MRLYEEETSRITKVSSLHMRNDNFLYSGEVGIKFTEFNVKDRIKTMMAAVVKVVMRSRGLI